MTVADQIVEQGPNDLVGEAVVEARLFVAIQGNRLVAESRCLACLGKNWIQRRRLIGGDARPSDPDPAAFAQYRQHRTNQTAAARRGVTGSVGRLLYGQREPIGDNDQFTVA